jgi:hypothetical protein
MLNLNARKLTRPKESYLLEKVILDRQAFPHSGSMATVGIDKTEGYSARWKRRKEAFLLSLVHKLSVTAP